MDVIADWLREVTQALQSEKVYSESERFHILSFAQEALVQKDPHATFTHALHTRLNY